MFYQLVNYFIRFVTLYHSYTDLSYVEPSMIFWGSELPRARIRW